MVRFLLFLVPALLSAEITALYLSWYGDPTSTMTIQWHTPEEEFGDTLFLQTDEDWQPISGEHTLLEGTRIHKVALSSLTPDTEYFFRIGDDPNTYHFRTAPDNLERPLRFLIGGDIYANTKLFRRMSKTVLENDPQFIVFGGDIAYAISVHPFRSSALRRWLAFLKDWKETMILADGKVIPFLIVPGNHDISSDNYDIFFSLFAFPNKQLYRAVDFGNYLSLILLDTGHFQPIEGRQTLWLDKALSARTQFPYRFAVYHEAAYPSFYPYQGLIPKKIRNNWVPLFEKHHILAAFENHNHAFKRTYPLKANQIDLKGGIVYIGDGSWGAPPRRTHDLWYLDKRARKNSVTLVELTQNQATIKTVDLLNNLLDETSLSPVNKQF